MSSREDLCYLLLTSAERHRLQRQGLTTIKDLVPRPTYNALQLLSGYDLYYKRKVGGLYTGRVYYDTECPPNVAVLKFNCKLHCDSWQEFVMWLKNINEELREKGGYDVLCIRNWDFHVYALNHDFRMRKKFLLPWVARLPRFDLPTEEEQLDRNSRSRGRPERASLPHGRATAEGSSQNDTPSSVSDTSGDRNAAGRDRRIRRELPEPHIPVTLVVAFLLVYMLCGSVVFSIFHDWTWFESFYFIFVSMSTIGFGDYVPEYPLSMMATFVYLLFGLALTSMCINVIQEKLNATFQKAKLHIALSLGLEPEAFQDEGLTTVYEDLREDLAERLDDVKRSSIVQL